VYLLGDDSAEVFMIYSDKLENLKKINIIFLNESQRKTFMNEKMTEIYYNRPC